MSDDTAAVLQAPVVRGDTTIDRIGLRKPTAGELRGLSLAALLQMDVGALCTLLPRISQPSITQAEANSLDPADLLALGSKVIDFLLPK